ncbi:MAG: chemotaxis protein CheA, partial [Gemmataceae bacterium]|nr:chemotaxis protein CheA [Gemmataceae bacterium]
VHLHDIIREFLVETHENLAQLDRDLVALEREPGDQDTLARVFRTVHSIKGGAGFLGFAQLQNVTHAGETLLGKVRAGAVGFGPDLAHIEPPGPDGAGGYASQIDELERLARAHRPAPPPVESRTPAVPLPPTPSGGAPETEAPTSTPSGHDAPEPRAPGVTDSSVRVGVGLLDRLMNLVGELVLARNQILQHAAVAEDAGFLGTVQRLNLLTTELQAGVMKTRMQPIGTVWGRFPRVVRDLALACGKRVALALDGSETELDRTIVEAIRDPLTHLVRNAIDHGIEPPAERVARGKPPEGRLSVRAFHEGGKVVVEIADDGGGIDPGRVKAKAVALGLVSPEQAARLPDPDAVDLIFAPGFSTADRVTQFSGRGVGMDVVRTNVEKLGGAVTVESRVGRGTTIRLRIPLTLAIVPALLVSAGGDRYAIPQVNLVELVRVEGEAAAAAVESVHGVPVFRLRGNLLPLVGLTRTLQVPADPAPDGTLSLVVLQADERKFGLVVSHIHDTEEIVVKPLQKPLKGLGVYSGATILGDGRVS